MRKIPESIRGRSRIKQVVNHEHGFSSSVWWMLSEGSQLLRRLAPSVVFNIHVRSLSLSNPSM